MDSKEEGQQFSVISQAQMKKLSKVYQREVGMVDFHLHLTAPSSARIYENECLSDEVWL